MSLLQAMNATTSAITIDTAAGSHMETWLAIMARVSAKKNPGKMPAMKKTNA